MDVLLQVLIGVSGGATVAALLPNIRPPSVTRLGRRRVRAMLAGLVGAVAAVYSLVLLDPSVGSDRLLTALAGLAGALWLAGIVDVYSSRRRRGEDGESRTVEREGSWSAFHTPAYNGTRQSLAGALLHDATAHEAGRYEEIGRELPGIRHAVSRHERPWSSRLQFALRFWHGWTKARDGRWREGQGAKPVVLEDWPRFARVIASDLALDRDTTDPRIVGRFADAEPLLAAASEAGARAAVPRMADHTAVRLNAGGGGA
jgi:hypothetical protein